MNIIVNIVTGVIQDRDNGRYDHVTIVYVVLAGCSVVVSAGLIILSHVSVDLGNLQWTRKQRLARGDLWNERKKLFHNENGQRNRAHLEDLLRSHVSLYDGRLVCLYLGRRDRAQRSIIIDPVLYEVMLSRYWYSYGYNNES